MSAKTVMDMPLWLAKPNMKVLVTVAVEGTVNLYQKKFVVKWQCLTVVR
jgi:hypothetical protein